MRLPRGGAARPHEAAGAGSHDQRLPDDHAGAQPVRPRWHLHRGSAFPDGWVAALVCSLQPKDGVSAENLLCDRLHADGCTIRAATRAVGENLARWGGAMHRTSTCSVTWRCGWCTTPGPCPNGSSRHRRTTRFALSSMGRFWSRWSAVAVWVPLEWPQVEVSPGSTFDGRTLFYPALGRTTGWRRGLRARSAGRVLNADCYSRRVMPVDAQRGLSR